MLIALHRGARSAPSDEPPSRSELARDVAGLVAPRQLGARPMSRAGARRVGAPRPTESASTTSASPVRGADVYGDVRDVFERNERWLRRNASAMDRIVERLRADPLPPGVDRLAPLQRELRLVVPTRGSGRGAFVLRNPGDAARDVVIEVARVRGLPTGPVEPPRLRVSPQRLALDPGESAEVRVSVDLAACPIGPDDEVEIALRAQCGDETWVLVWVVLIVEEGTPGG